MSDSEVAVNLASDSVLSELPPEPKMPPNQMFKDYSIKPENRAELVIEKNA